MSKDSRQDRNHIDALTWLRGVAAFFVIVSHVVRATEVQYSVTDEPVRFFLTDFFAMGPFGVILFFVLSGSTLYFSNGAMRGLVAVQRFYLKRFFRIWPAFVLALLVYILFGLFFSALYIEPQGVWVERQFLASYTVNDVLAYMTLVFNITGPKELFNGAFWSLPVEFQYYLLFPLIVLSLRCLGLAGPVCLAALLYLVPVSGLFDVASTNVFTLAFSFCGGVLLAHCYRRFQHYRLHEHLGLGLSVLLVCLASAIRNDYIVFIDIPVISEKWNWYGLIAIAMVYLMLVTDFRSQGTVARLLKRYGEVSYSTYLYHNVFIGLSVLLMVNAGIETGWLKILLTFWLTFAGSYLVAELSFRYVEMPSMQFGRRLAGRLPEAKKQRVFAK